MPCLNWVDKLGTYLEQLVSGSEHIQNKVCNVQNTVSIGWFHMFDQNSPTNVPWYKCPVNNQLTKIHATYLTGKGVPKTQVKWYPFKISYQKQAMYLTKIHHWSLYLGKNALFIIQLTETQAIYFTYSPLISIPW